MTYEKKSKKNYVKRKLIKFSLSDFFHQIQFIKFSLFCFKSLSCIKFQKAFFFFFLDTRYRRSYDSEYTAPLVNHHIWPALIQGVRTLVKGEAVTRRGASLVCFIFIIVQYFILNFITSVFKQYTKNNCNDQSPMKNDFKSHFFKF